MAEAVLPNMLLHLFDFVLDQGILYICIYIYNYRNYVYIYIYVCVYICVCLYISIQNKMTRVWSKWEART